MGKIYSSSKHSHQDGKVPYMGKGPMMSYKIQKKRTPHKAASVHTEENSSETDIPTGLGFENTSQILTDPTHTAAVTHTDSEGEVKHETNFLGKYCEYCDRCGETHCWCFTSDWEKGLDVNYPNSSVEILPSPTARKPPAGWYKNRCRVIKKKDTTRTPLAKGEISTDSGTSMHWVLAVKFGGG